MAQEKVVETFVPDNWYETLSLNKERVAALADFLVHLEEGDSAPLDDTVAFMLRQAEDCYGDMKTMLEALDNQPQKTGR